MTSSQHSEHSPRLTLLWEAPLDDNRAHGLTLNQLPGLLITLFALSQPITSLADTPANATTQQGIIDLAPDDLNAQLSHLIDTMDLSPVHSDESGITRLNTFPDVFHVDDHLHATVQEGAHIETPYGLLVKAPFEVLINDGERIVRCEKTTVKCYSTVRPPLWADWAPRAALEVPVAPPRPAERVQMQPTLAKHVHTLSASSRPFDTLCALGTTLRGHQPLDRNERLQVLNGLSVSPFIEIREWLAGLDQRQLTGFRYEAICQAQQLTERLTLLIDHLQISEEPTQLIEQIVRSRDQLEDAFVVLCERNQGETLLDALRETDTVAAHMVDALHSTSYQAPEWLELTCFAQPSAWWRDLGLV